MRWGNHTRRGMLLSWAVLVTAYRKLQCEPSKLVITVLCALSPKRVSQAQSSTMALSRRLRPRSTWSHAPSDWLLRQTVLELWSNAPSGEVCHEPEALAVAPFAKSQSRGVCWGAKASFGPSAIAPVVFITSFAML